MIQFQHINNLYADWEFNVAGVYNYRRYGQFHTFFEFVKLNHEKLSGDIVESGVYRGNSIVAMGLMLRELGSTKKIYGYDSFSGFPPKYHESDGLENFTRLCEKGLITNDHFNAVQKNIFIRSNFKANPIDVGNISGSGNFSETTRELVERKIDLFKLDNIVLVEGAFEDTMNTSQGPSEIMAVLMDCDLYQSYHDTFAFVWDKLVKGGIIYLDEYFSLKFPGARIASDEFLALHRNVARLIRMQKDFADFERWYIEKQ